MFAVAQKKYVYIYDRTGAEVHSLRRHTEPNRLEFLPYHFLLASVGETGYLKYQDTSTGAFVAEWRTRAGRCDVMTQNPQNAVIHLGHHNGTITLWSPASSTALVKILAHRGPVLANTVDNTGKYMATSGLDGQMKIWDLRMFKAVHEYYTPTPAQSLDFSQLGLLSVAWGGNVQIWKDVTKSKQQSPYMSHSVQGSRIENVEFVPFDDVLGVGHAAGISSLVIPGSGEPNIDSLEVNPYATARQRQEMEVHGLLDKVQPDSIGLDPNVFGAVKPKLVSQDIQEKTIVEKLEIRYKTRGKNSALRRYLRKKQVNVITARKQLIERKLDEEKRLRAAENGRRQAGGSK